MHDKRVKTGKSRSGLSNNSTCHPVSNSVTSAANTQLIRYCAKQETKCNVMCYEYNSSSINSITYNRQ